MLELDTDGAPPAERARVVTGYLSAAVGRCRVTHLCGPASAWGRSRCAQLSPNADVCLYDGSAFRITRRAADVGAESTERLTFAVPGAEGTLWQEGGIRRLGPDELVLIDAGAPYDFRGTAGTLSLVRLDRAGLGVSAVQARAAARRLHNSSLHDLAREHVRALVAIAFLPETQTVALGDLGTATTLLFAALLHSCGAGPGRR